MKEFMYFAKDDIADIKKSTAYIAKEIIYRGKFITSGSKKTITVSRSDLPNAYKAVLKRADVSKDISLYSRRLIDNFYLFEQQIKNLSFSLTIKQIRLLPKMARGTYKGLPRIYAIASEILSLFNCRVDEEAIVTYIEQLQQEVTLEMEELDVLKNMLMLCLLNACASIAKEEEKEQEDILRADKWIATLKTIVAETALNDAIEKMANEKAHTGAFIERLNKRFSETDKQVIIDKYMALIDGKGIDAKELIDKSKNDNLSREELFFSCIESIRTLTSMPFDSIYESLCLVECELKKDEVYKAMDDSSRQYYRRRIELMAKTIDVAEIDIAKKAIELAENDEGIEGHVGFYIISEGQKKLFKELEKPFKGKSTEEKFNTYKNTIFSVSIFFVLLSGYFVFAKSNNASLALIAGILLFLPVYTIIQRLLNDAILRWIKPAFMPKIELKELSAKNKTIVITPRVITDRAVIDEAKKDLETYYLANEDKHIYFALLGDFPDAEKQLYTKDIKLMEYAASSIQELNNKYNREKSIFYYLQRSRGFSETQQCFIPPDRKRGSVEYFNNLLLNKEGAKEKYAYISEELPQNVPYVITLDSDTRLIMGSAKKLIGTIVHPLNKPLVSDDGRIIRGYSIIQPRISTDVISAGRSPFANIYCGQTGLDVYSSAVSDVYMDLFGEGIFTGKGLYDVKAFSAATKDKMENEQILSHDLLEGIITRVGYASDVQLSDGFPMAYTSFMKRQHRWIRGDWQLLPFLKKENRKKAHINSFAAFKITDNLIRSLLPIFALLILLLGIFCQTSISVYIVTVALLSLFINVILDFFTSLYVYATSNELKANAKDMLYESKVALLQSLLNITFLPFAAAVNTSAIVKTIYRLTVSKKKLLEWNTAAAVEKKHQNSLVSYYTEMIAAPILGATTLAFTYFLWDLSIPYVVLGVAWLLAPCIAFIISQKSESDKYTLKDSEKQYIRMHARLTWAYFEDFINEENNYLIPDNYQHTPNKNIAYRTSPTNIGLSLASIIAANDLGYLDANTMQKQITCILDTIDNLEKWNGHLLNWYDTKTLKPLNPLYISSVDSGNLAAYIIVCLQAINQKLDKTIIEKQQIKGLIDTLNLVETKSEKIEKTIETCIALEKEIEVGIDAQEISKVVALVDSIIELKLVDEWGKKATEIANGYSEFISGVLCYIKPLDAIKEELSKAVSYGDIEQNIEKIERLIIENLSVNGLIKVYPQIVEQILIIKTVIKTEEKSAQEAIAELQNCMLKGHALVKKHKAQAEGIMARLNTLFNDMDFTCVFDKTKQLFATGYSLEEGRLSSSSYDMLASEARQTSFIAIAKGEVDKKHWFKLARPLTVVGGSRMLISWGGTMFEYLMPLLTMKTNNNTILGETYKSLINAHINYGKSKNVPWGVSESGYYRFDGNIYYQYKAFGLPKTGLKTGLSNDTVIAPYATCMALMVQPYSSIKNMHALQKTGAFGKYGFYEALDYTKSRLYGGKHCLIVKSFMAHHLGMSMLAFDNVLNNNVIQEYFHSAPNIRSVQSLLDESIPARNVVMSSYQQDTQERPAQISDVGYSRTYEVERGMDQHVHFLSNGEYTVYLNCFGGGQSICNGQAINRFRGDMFMDTKGIFFYIKNTENKNTWSATVAPINVIPSKCTVQYDEDKASYTRIDGQIKTKVEVCVCADRNAEIRKLTITNNGSSEAELEVTSFFEVSLSHIADDWSHAQFYNLFVGSYYDKKTDSLIFKRRKRSKKDKVAFIYNKLIASGETSYETNRAEFIERGRDISNPKAIDEQLKNTEGIVIDPCASLRKRIRVGANKSTELYYVLGMEYEETDAIKSAAITKKAAEEAFSSSKMKTAIGLTQLDVTSDLLELYLELQDVIYATTQNKEKEQAIKNNIKPLSSLWCYGISGNNPIILCYAKGLDQLDNVITLIKAAAYYEMHGATMDIVIINREEKGYYEPLRDKLNESISSKIKKSVHLININEIKEDELYLLEAICRIKFDCKQPLIDQIKEQKENNILCDLKYAEASLVDGHVYSSPQLKEIDESFDNGFGGFASEGSQYAIDIKNGKVPPMPYSNVIANPQFGTLVNDGGICFSFAENSRENKLTDFENDSIDQSVSQTVYVRDDETLIYNSISREPVKREAQYRVTHGKGYSVYECSYNGLLQKKTVHVDMDKKLTYITVNITNASDKTRKISVYYYADILLGVDSRHRQKLLYTGYDNGIIYAKNSEAAEFTGVAFAACPGQNITFTGNKRCFVGDGRSMKNPKAMLLDSLDDDSGIGECCFALKATIELEINESKNITFVLGYEHTLERAEKAVEGFALNRSAEISLVNAQKFWDELCGRIKVTTPDESFNYMVNGWLQYQMLSCRVWARTGFYQVGGAYGFRDQLQDMLSVMLLNEDIARKYIISCAAHQFEDGDVQHWWHPPAVGVRTHIKDDLLFLPYVVAQYVSKTGDDTILSETAHYLKNVYIDPSKEDVYVNAKASEKTGTIHEHCKKAIEKAMSFGEHGLPLMGRGDWNDGMNAVGENGRGESVWLGFFFYDVLKKYLDILRLTGEVELESQYKKTMKDLKLALNTDGWDGTWFKRAYFDDGTPLGSVYNEECKIDCISQAFSVISGATTALKAESAMESVYNMLVDKDTGIVKLLWPAFDKSEQEPGYIKGYNPGVRENGGQYTHGAIWAIIAFAMLKQPERAYELFHMMNPINHTKTELQARKYKGEPYAMAADVYDANGSKGRSGWTWYTGSASWMYKAAIEDILGFKKRGELLYINPCLPKQFKNVSIEYKYKETLYRITIENDHEYVSSENDKVIKLVNDKGIHEVIVRV